MWQSKSLTPCFNPPSCESIGHGSKSRPQTSRVCASPPPSPSSRGGKKYYLTLDDIEAVSEASETIKTPWVLGLQDNERNIVWNDELAERLLFFVASRDLNIDEIELLRRLDTVTSLVPDLRNKVPNMKADLLIKLMSDTNAIARRILFLKRIFPTADVSLMVSNQPTLLIDDDDGALRHAQRTYNNKADATSSPTASLGDSINAGAATEAWLTSSATKLRAALPGLNVDYYVQEQPQLLAIEDINATIAHIKQLYLGSDQVPDAEIMPYIANNPMLLFQAQSKAGLVPYDEIAPEENDYRGYDPEDS